MAETTYDNAPPSVLDRTIDLTRVGWVTIGAIVVIAVGIALRFAPILTCHKARDPYPEPGETLEHSQRC